MFKKRERLDRNEFAAVFATGRRRHFAHCTIITAPAEHRKVSVVAGKKVAKRAVRRNLLRRRVYAVLRELCDTHNFSAACIILLKPSFATLPRKAAEEFLRASIAEALQSA